MKLLITGASGRLGGHLVVQAQARGWPVTAWRGRGQVDLLDRASLQRALGLAEPEAIIHTAAWSSVNLCQQRPEEARRLNAQVPGWLAELRGGARLISVSTDMVFDGERAPYQEQDPPAPLSVYGCTKLEGEREVLDRGQTVVRTALMHGPSLTVPGFYEEQVDLLRRGEPLRLFSDEWRTPLSYAEAAWALLELAPRAPAGIFHLGGPERLSRFEMGQRLAVELGLDGSSLVAITRADFPAAEPRPRDLSLDSGKLRRLLAGVEGGADNLIG